MTYTIQQLLVCGARSDGGPPIAPCGTDGVGVGYQPSIVSAGVFDTTTAALLDANSGPIDYQVAAEFWGFGFTTVLSFWAVSKVAGYILAAIRNG